jgi:peptidoglycan/LPS O-acetylase OafA/YrhL
MTHHNRYLAYVLTFNAVTAIVGGVGLLFGFISPPSEWLDHTFLHNYVVPGLVLFFVVGGSAAFAAHAVARNRDYYREASGAAGLIMMMWIIAEIAVIKHFNILQGAYYILGYLVISLAYPSVDHHAQQHTGRRSHA